LTNVVHSMLDVPPPSSEAPGLLDTLDAHVFAIAYASLGIAPTAVANESINRRFTSCTAALVSFSKVRSDEYRASRSASVRAMNVPVGVRNLRVVIGTTTATGFGWSRPCGSGTLSPMNPNGNVFYLIVAGLVAFVFLLFLLVFFTVIRIWVKALLSGVPVGLANVIGMRLRGNPPSLIVDALIALKFQNVPANVREVEGTYMAHKNAVYGAADLVGLVEKGARGKT
jgi:hypothetical protein